MEPCPGKIKIAKANDKNECNTFTCLELFESYPIPSILPIQFEFSNPSNLSSTLRNFHAEGFYDHLTRKTHQASNHIFKARKVSQELVMKFSRLHMTRLPLGKTVTNNLQAILQQFHSLVNSIRKFPSLV